MSDIIDEIRTDVKKVLVVQERHEAQLAEHMRRTQLLEEAVKPLTEKELARAGFFRVGSVIAGLIATAAGAVEIFFHVKHLL